MSAQIIPFDFEEQAVRVIMRDGDPWFVAADVCRVLDIGNPSDAVGRLDADEIDMVNLNTLDIAEGIRGNPNARIISESGLYALIFTSRKAEARRFRKWVTAEVLPSLRRTGRFEIPANDNAPRIEPDASFAGISQREAELWLSAVREARLVRGPRAAVEVWKKSPLPPLSNGGAAPGMGDVTEDQARACLDHLLSADLGGKPVRVLLREAEAGKKDAEARLARHGFKATGGAIFIANSSAYVFRVYRHSRWTEGGHRAALLAVPGAFIPVTPRSLCGQAQRGIIVPVACASDEGAGA